MQTPSVLSDTRTNRVLSECDSNGEKVRRDLRSHIHSSVQPRVMPMPEDDEDEGGDSDNFDRHTARLRPLFGYLSHMPACRYPVEMSFSYWGADNITLQKPLAKHRPGPGGNGSRRNGPAVPSGYSRESSANAKFGNRLVSADSSLAAAARPASRRTVNTPSRRPPTFDEGNSVKVTVTRPAWDGSTRTPAISAQSTKRSRNTSQNSAATRTTTTPSNNKLLASPAPSEDSGVGLGLYRQMMANDSSLNNDQP
jgi:hypothetical protein